MLLDQTRHYLFVGGMPECVGVYAETGSLRDVFEVQDELATACREDFGKYAPRADKDCLNSVLSSVARDVGRQTKYVRLADGFKSPTIKRAFDLLTMAQVARKVRAASPAGLPLRSSASEKRFKALLVDVGLMQRLSGLRADVEYAKADLLAVYDGALAEQFVGQELAAATLHDLLLLDTLRACEQRRGRLPDRDGRRHQANRGQERTRGASEEPAHASRAVSGLCSGRSAVQRSVRPTAGAEVRHRAAVLRWVSGTRLAQ